MKTGTLAGATLALLISISACGGSSPPAATPAAEAPPAPPSAATPTIGPDECCCPFASAEGVAFNVSPRAECEANGSECVEDASCQRE